VILLGYKNICAVLSVLEEWKKQPGTRDWGRGTRNSHESFNSLGFKPQAIEKYFFSLFFTPPIE